MKDMGVKRFIEVGPGRVLAGLVKRTVKDVDILSVESPDDIKALI